MSQINRLQAIQYSCARLVKRLPRRHINMKAVLKELHWLPISERISYEICLVTHKCIYGSAPSYLKELIQPSVASSSDHSLRSDSAVTLYRPLSRLSRCGGFAHCAPREWNRLPAHLRSITDINAFKRRLKTHLMQLAFD